MKHTCRTHSKVSIVVNFICVVVTVQRNMYVPSKSKCTFKKCFVQIGAGIQRGMYLPAAVLKMGWNHGDHKLYWGYTGWREQDKIPSSLEMTMGYLKKNPNCIDHTYLLKGTVQAWQNPDKVIQVLHMFFPRECECEDIINTKILLQKAQVLKARDSIILGAETVTTDLQ